MADPKFAPTQPPNEKLGLDRIVRESADLVESGGKAAPEGRAGSGGPDVSRRTASETPPDILGPTLRELGKARVDGKPGGR